MLVATKCYKMSLLSSYGPHRPLNADTIRRRKIEYINNYGFVYCDHVFVLVVVRLNLLCQSPL